MSKPPIFIFRFVYSSRPDDYAVQQGMDDNVLRQCGGISSRLNAFALAQSWANDGDPEDVKPLIFFHEDAVGHKGNHHPDYTHCVPAPVPKKS